MKQKNLWILWLIAYIICFIAGFIPEATGFGKALLVCISLCFFIPGGLLLYDAHRRQDHTALMRLRIISLSSLLLTVIFFIANLLSVFSSDVVGTVLHVFLSIASVPMFAMQYWLGSLFLWSCLFIGTFLGLYRQ